MFAFCWQSGQIGFGNILPKGALPIGKSNRKDIRKIVSSICRWGYDNKTLLVPGVPESNTSDEAFEAFMKFRGEVEKRLKDDEVV